MSDEQDTLLAGNESSQKNVDTIELANQGSSRSQVSYKALSDDNIGNANKNDLSHKSLNTIIKSDVDPNKPKKITNRVFYNILIVYFSVFLDNMGVSIVQPILPYYAAEFDANSVQLGMLYSSYSLMATIATIGMAKGSDRWGRRPMICFSLFGTMSGFLLTGLAWDYWSLLAFRFYTGAFGGSFSVAQAYMTDVCPPNEVEKYLAGVGGTMAIAFIIGPLLGGILWQYGSGVPFFASSGAGLVGFLVAIFFLQESYFPNKEKIENVIDTNDDDIKVDVSMDDITEAKTDDKVNETKEDTVAITDDKKIEIGDGSEEEKQENPCQKIPVPVW
eukprot:CAMPEP_0114660420 /NCGR_PEP_ID=MMETSP0191-20121206/19987_1 /TAXON_ID=126664 /ORGANISM="Sorites sp." /LENGTH=331 /DNA_ID=CAMNT_0001888939 /DNA_START=17 /DNA_END=1009 /DNA_ORIENTATION=-